MLDNRCLMETEETSRPSWIERTPTGYRIPIGGPVTQGYKAPTKITHGRHCTCSACEGEDWTNPDLACCGMHGEVCPALYQPLGPAGTPLDWREAAAEAVRDYMRSDPERCMPTCRVGCPCDGGMQDGATGAPDAALEIVDIVAKFVGGEGDA